MTVLTCAHRRGTAEGTALPPPEVPAVKMGDFVARAFQPEHCGGKRGWF